MTLETLQEIVEQLLSNVTYIKHRPATDLEMRFNVHDAYYVACMYPDYVINTHNYSSCYYGNCNNGSEHSETCNLLSAFDKWCEVHPAAAKGIYRIAFSEIER